MSRIRLIFCILLLAFSVGQSIAMVEGTGGGQEVGNGGDAAIIYFADKGVLRYELLDFSEYAISDEFEDLSSLETKVALAKKINFHQLDFQSTLPTFTYKFDLTQQFANIFEVSPFLSYLLINEFNSISWHDTDEVFPQDIFDEGQILLDYPLGIEQAAVRIRDDVYVSRGIYALGASYGSKFVHPFNMKSRLGLIFHEVIHGVLNRINHDREDRAVVRKINAGLFSNRSALYQSCLLLGETLNKSKQFNCRK